MANSTSPAPFTIRPYRSHKYPACSFCRNRKTRCDFDVPGQPCRLCRGRKLTCDFGGRNVAPERNSNIHENKLEQDVETSPNTALRPTKRTRYDQNSVDKRSPVLKRADETTLSGFPSVAGTSPTESSLMMNPHMAEDITVLQQYLTSNTTTSERQTPSRLYNTISTGPGGSPVVYLTLPKRRRGLNASVDPGRAQREIIENVLGSLSMEVQKTYSAHLHPCFPVLDEKTFLEMWRDDSERISPTLICDLYASAMQVWNRSAVLRHKTRPDPHFIWNQAVSALQDDFMAPSISTVHAAVLDLLGRPVIGVTGNIVNAGRVVTLAQSLGLHRDPSSWRATDHEKSVRINLWWGVLIHDYWSSVGHGIPPTINPRYYDVPIPTSTAAAVSDPQAQAQFQENATFIQLCKLSQILGDILPLVYSLRDVPEDLKRHLRRVECALDDWVLELPEYLNPSRSTTVIINGSCNLWFAYLSVKLLVYRLSFKTVSGDADESPEARHYRLAMLRDAASQVIDFAASLTETQLEEFWMPYTSYLLITAATILLRCTVEANDPATKQRCITKLVLFRDRLRLARDMSHWDLADACLERCDEPIQKIADTIGLCSRGDSGDSTNIRPTVPTSAELDLTMIDTSAMNDLFLPIDPLDYPWETLWDSMEGPW